MTDLLAGLRVLDFTLAAVGPFCSRILADLGAEVIHVEYPLPGWGYDAEGPESRFEAEGLRTTPANRLFLHTNGGKKSLAVNLKDPRGVQIIWDLIPQTDIVVENMTPRVMQRLGLSYVTLSDINPRLIMCSLTGFGQEGLEGDLGRPSSDPIAQAMSGMNWNTGDRDGPPYAVGGGIGDPITAVNGVVGILAAMLGLNATGKGQHIDISMVDANLFVDCTIAPAVAMFGSQAAAPYRNGQNQSYTFPMGTFKATGGYISIQANGSGELSPWARLCELMGREDLADAPGLPLRPGPAAAHGGGRRDRGGLALLTRQPRGGPRIARGGTHHRRPGPVPGGNAHTPVVRPAWDLRQGRVPRFGNSRSG